MKKLILFFIMLASSLFIFVASCTPATATPTGTVNAYLDAIVAKNPQSLVSYESEDYRGMTRAERIEYYETHFEGIKSYSYTNRNLVVESLTTTTAVVSVSFSVLMTTIDDSTTDDIGEALFHLTKVDGKWLLSDYGAGEGEADSRETEERKTEKRDIENAVIDMIVDNDISSIPNPHNVAGGVAYNDMMAFPDSTSACTTADKRYDSSGSAYTVKDKDGYLLYGHDNIADDRRVTKSYVSSITTTYYYTCESDGTVRQWSDADMTTEYTD